MESVYVYAGVGRVFLLRSNCLILSRDIILPVLFGEIVCFFDLRSGVIREWIGCAASTNTNGTFWRGSKTRSGVRMSGIPFW